MQILTCTIPRSLEIALDRYIERTQQSASAVGIHFRAPSCMCTLALGVKENSSAVEKGSEELPVYLLLGAQSPWQPCFDHAAPSEWSMRASPTVNAVGSITIL